MTGVINAIMHGISIHALREESDIPQHARSPSNSLFQSTLSVRRATDSKHCNQAVSCISIHALREESDSSRLFDRRL